MRWYLQSTDCGRLHQSTTWGGGRGRKSTQNMQAESGKLPVAMCHLPTKSTNFVTLNHESVVLTWPAGDHQVEAVRGEVHRAAVHRVAGRVGEVAAQEAVLVVGAYVGHQIAILWEPDMVPINQSVSHEYSNQIQVPSLEN